MSTLETRGWRWLWAAIAAALLAGCATVPGVSPGQLQQAKHIAVASIAGDEAWFGYAGMTVFENSQSTLPIADWGLDARIEAGVDEALRAAGARQVTRLAVDRAPLAQAFRKPRLPEQVETRWREAAFQAPLLTAARAAGADLLVLVPIYRPPAMHLSERLFGFSVSAKGTPLYQHPQSIIAVLSARVAAVEVSSGRLLSERVVFSDPRMTVWNGSRPYQAFEPAQWRKTFATPPTGDGLARVRAAFEQLTAPVGGAVVRLLDPPPAEPVRGSAPR
jgi:hypothetical protein